MYHTTGFAKDDIVELCALIHAADSGADRVGWPPILGLFKSVVVALTYFGYERDTARRGRRSSGGLVNGLRAGRRPATLPLQPCRLRPGHASNGPIWPYPAHTRSRGARHTPWHRWRLCLSQRRRCTGDTTADDQNHSHQFVSSAMRSGHPWQGFHREFRVDDSQASWLGR
jgi:hypothetical protein